MKLQSKFYNHAKWSVSIVAPPAMASVQVHLVSSFLTENIHLQATTRKSPDSV